MISKELVKELVVGRIAELDRGLFVVDIQINSGNNIVVEIDSPTGVTFDECVSVSRNIEHNLDREKADFSLQVMSPGLGNPFKVREQYTKNIGKEVAVQTNDGKMQEGVLTELDEETLSIEYQIKERLEGRKKKEWKTYTKTVKLEDIVMTKNVLKF